MFKIQSLTPEILHIIRNNGTEYPQTGEYNHLEKPGSYLCRQCGLALFRADSKFSSSCGWPSFDEDIQNAVTSKLDKDGHRIEIICSRCQGHLGHVFHGEYLTEKNTRFCVNSLSLDFVEDLQVKDSEEGIFAAGCFWGVEHYFKKLPGVLKTQVGYIGGHQKNPTYQDICEGYTGHLEAVRVVYDPQKINYESVAKYFFEIHDPTQFNGQGPDLGDQYHSVIFCYDQHQHQIARSLITILENQDLAIATRILPMDVFWKAEDYHQDYYQKTGKHPYCHRYVKRFG